MAPSSRFARNWDWRRRQKATVRFSGFGRMKLMTHYANLQRVPASR